MKEALDTMPELQRRRLALKVLKVIDFAIYVSQYNSPITDDASDVSIDDNNTELTL